MNPIAPLTNPFTRTEDQILLACVREFIRSEGTSEVRAILRKKVDWEYLLAKSLTHGLLPIVCQRLEAASDVVPETTLQQFRTHFRKNAARNLFLTAELIRLVEIFKEAGIPTLPHKGPLLAASLYGDLALRQFSDLDLLVHEQHMEKGMQLLRTEGYSAPFYEKLGAHETEYARYRREYTLVRADGKVVVELEWDIMPSKFPVRFNLPKMWTRRQPVNLAARVVWTFSPEDLLLVICAQSAVTYWLCPFARLCDIGRMLCLRNDMDWEYILKSAYSAGSARVLFLGLSLASRLLCAPLPPEISRRMNSDPMVAALFRQISNRLLREELGRPSNLEMSLFDINVRERFQDKILYLLRRAFTPTEEDWHLVSLPHPLFFLYRLIRIVRLLGKFFSGLIGGIRCLYNLATK